MSWRFWKREKTAPDARNQGESSVEHEVERGPARELRTVPVQLGLDFGTSSAKAVYRRLDSGEYRAIAWGDEGKTGSKYCRSTEVPLGREVLRNLKAWIAAETDTRYQRDPEYARARDVLESARLPREAQSFQAQGASLVAELIRECEAWIVEELELRGEEPDLIVHVGVPVDYFASDGTLDRFRRVLACAELIWKGGHDPADTDYWSVVDKLLNEAEYRPTSRRSMFRESRNARVFGCPELVALCHAFLAGPMRPKGKIAVVDIGAGTVDIAIGRLLPSASRSERVWYSSRVIPGGCRPILSELEELIDGGDGEDIRIKAHELVMQIGEDWPKFEPDFKEEILSAILRGMRKVRDSTCDAWKEALEHDKHASHWENCTVLLGGASALLPNADEAWREPWFPPLRGKYSYEVMALECPGDLASDAVGQKEFARLVVAYGLASILPDSESDTFPWDLAAPPDPPRRRPIWDSETGKMIDPDNGQEYGGGSGEVW